MENGENEGELLISSERDTDRNLSPQTHHTWNITEHEVMGLNEWATRMEIGGNIELLKTVLTAEILEIALQLSKRRISV